MPADPPPPPRRHFQLKPKENFERANAADVADHASLEHDVVSMHLRATGQDPSKRPVAPTPVIPRKRRGWHYALLMIAGNAPLAYFAQYGDRIDNPFIFFASVGGIISYTVGVTWIVWFVMGSH